MERGMVIFPKDNPYICTTLRSFNKYISVFLLAVISAFIVPKELVHALYDHEDTVHSISHNETGLPEIENIHQHCDILNFNVPLYFLTLNFYPAPFVTQCSKVIQPAVEVFFSPAIGLSPLRGPPVR